MSKLIIVCGAGGKTSYINNISKKYKNKKVIITTTTKIFKTENYTTSQTRFFLQFLSEGDAAAGNDFACESVFLFKLQTSAVTAINKTVYNRFAREGDVLLYTLTFTNTSLFTITNVYLEENISPYVIINRSSLVINNVPSPSSWGAIEQTL